MNSELSDFSRVIDGSVRCMEVLDVIPNATFFVSRRKAFTHTYNPDDAASDFERKPLRAGAFGPKSERTIIKNVVEVPKATVQNVRKSERRLRNKISAALLERGAALVMANSNAHELLNAYMKDIEGEDATITDDIGPYVHSIVNIETVYATLEDSPLPVEIRNKIMDHVIDQSMGDAHSELKQNRREVSGKVLASVSQGVSNSIGIYRSRGTNGPDKSTRST